MRSAPNRFATLPRMPLAVLAATVADRARRPAPAWSSSRRGVRGPRDHAAGRASTTVGDAPAQLDPLTPAGVAPSSADLDRIRANITFWGEKLAADDRDFVSATRLAGSQIELARATGDIGAYLAAGTAVDRALAANPDYGAGPRLPRGHPRRAPPLRGRPRLRDRGPRRPAEGRRRPRDARRCLPRARRRGRGPDRLRHAGPRWPTARRPASARATSPSSRAGPPTRSRSRGPRSTRPGRGRGRQRARLVPLPAGRHADRDRATAPARPRPTATRSPPTRPRTWPTGGWPASPPRTAGSTTPSRSSTPPSRSCRCPSSSPAAPTCTRCAARPAMPAREAADRKTVLAIAQLAGRRRASTTGPCRCTWPTRRSTRPARCARRGRDRGPQGRLRLRCARLGAARQRPAGRSRRGHDRRRSRSGPATRSCSTTPG